MTWLTTLRDQLPLLLVLSPVIGFLVTVAAARAERDLVRHLAISNSVCTLILFGAVFWQFELDRRDAAATQRAFLEETANNTQGSTLEMVHGLMERHRAERLSQSWFVIDGTNLWPTFVLVVLTGVVFWQTKSTSAGDGWFFPCALVFQSASIAAFMSYDLRVHMMAVGTSVLSMSVIIGKWGGPDRRRLFERFLMAQFCGSSLVMYGFAMLVVAMPWMKIEDSPTLPTISWHIATIAHQVQKWTSGNELAYQYQIEVFPWMLLVLSVGFAIQAGLFPFHSWQVSLLSHVPGSVGVLVVAGLFSQLVIGWMRFVVPLAPDLMAAFDWLILFPALGGAVWGSLRAIVSESPRQRAAFQFLSVAGLSMLGEFSFNPVALSGAWLMQQQLIVTFCAVLLAISPRHLLKMASRSSAAEGAVELTVDQSGGLPLSVRWLLMLICLPMFGLFGSSFIIVSELVGESLLLAACYFAVVGALLLSVTSMVNQVVRSAFRPASHIDGNVSFSGPMLVVIALVAAVNLFPNQLLHQCEPELARGFRRFERPLSADSAEPAVEDRQEMP